MSLFPNPELLGHYTPIRNRNCLAWPASTFPVLTPASPTSVRPRSLPPSHRSPTRPHRWPTQDRSAMQTHRFTGRPQSTRKPALTRMALTKAREVRKTVPFSPCGRRWREAPVEGSAAQLRRTAPNSPLPSPLLYALWVRKGSGSIRRSSQCHSALTPFVPWPRDSGMLPPRVHPSQPDAALRETG